MKFSRQNKAARARVQQRTWLFFEGPRGRRARAVAHQVVRLRARRPEFFTRFYALCKRFAGEAHRARTDGRNVPLAITKQVIESHANDVVWASFIADAAEEKDFRGDTKALPQARRAEGASQSALGFLRRRVQQVLRLRHR